MLALLRSKPAAALFFSFLISMSGSAIAGNAAAGMLKGLADGLGEMADRQIEQDRQRALLEQQLQFDRRRIEQQQQLQEFERQRILQQQQQERQEQAQRQRDEAEAAKRKVAEEKRTATLTGTGFFVTSTGYLVTNAHVVADKTHFAVRNNKGQFFRATVKATDRSRDLALLQVTGDFAELRIAPSSEVSKGQRVYTIGFPQPSIQGSESKVTDGIVNSFSGLNNDTSWFQISVPIQGGNSGGPLMNEHGDVVGVVVASVNAGVFYSDTGNLPQNINFAIKSSVLMEFLAAQQVSAARPTKAKTTIEFVDNATVLVISANQPIQITYASPPLNKSLEDAKLDRLYPTWRSTLASAKFRSWLDYHPISRSNLASVSSDDRAGVLRDFDGNLAEERAAASRAAEMETQKLQVERQKAAEEREAVRKREIARRLADRDLAITKIFPTWPQLKDDTLFTWWLSRQASPTSITMNSQDPVAIAKVIDRYNRDPEARAAIQQRVAEAEDRLQKRQIESVFPNWATTVQDANFIAWVRVQPEDVQRLYVSSKSMDVIDVIHRYNAAKLYLARATATAQIAPSQKAYVEIGQVTSVYPQYGYLVFALTSTAGGDKGDVVIASTSGDAVGKIEKRVGDNVSVTVSSTSLQAIMVGARVGVWR